MADDGPTEPDPSGGSSRKWRILAGVAVLAAFVSVGVLGSLLLGGNSTPAVDSNVLACIPSRDFTADADSAAGDTCPPPGAEFVEGLVGKSDGGTFSMRPIVDGDLGASVKLTVREPDRPYVDVQHAQSHAALGQPVRVYTQPFKGKDVVVYMVDAPLPASKK